MITVRQAHEHGKTQTSGLDSHHTFSFHRYDDPRYTGFRDLLVINKDTVAPGMGFGTHGHQNREIISYLVEGPLALTDSTGVSSIIDSGDVQRMSAGTGVRHRQPAAHRHASTPHGSRGYRHRRALFRPSGIDAALWMSLDFPGYVLSGGQETYQDARRYGGAVYVQRRCRC